MNHTFNETDTGFLEDHLSFMLLYLKLFRADFLTDCIMLPLGIVIQAWLLLAIVTSPGMRGRMRNKIIASFCVQHLLECLIFLPLNMDLDHRVFFGEMVSCHQLHALSNIILMQDFITNWTLVIFVAVYLAQVRDYTPQARLPALPACRAAFTILNKRVVATFALLASPWMIAFVIFPTMITYSRAILTQEHLGDCYFDYGDGYYIFKSVDTAVPPVFGPGASRDRGGVQTAPAVWGNLWDSVAVAGRVGGARTGCRHLVPVRGGGVGGGSVRNRTRPLIYYGDWSRL
ncbi:unnamed protein product [Lymnaea stagnalis]|uniref:G-protein coupled receptors family 1 profile domain-containing protein n=1 Tax=Lymnaea stagnalis TaxID=6523 RepID=A0AAV2I630_LYMST